MNEPAPGKLFGKYRGIVINNVDPMNRARLLVKAPTVLGDLEAWAMPCVPYAGSDVGFLFLPDHGTGVWLEFEAGDPSFPIWSGFFWDVGQSPPAAPGAKTKVIRTRAVTLVLDDDVPEVRIAADGGGVLTVGDDVILARDAARVRLTDNGVTIQSGSGAQVIVTGPGVSINDGALDVR